MAIVINFAGASLRKPGAYSRVKVAPGGAAQAQLGVMAIIGESDTGPAFSAESGLSAVAYSPDKYNSIKNKYGTGQLVDAAKLALSPSNDPQINGGAQILYVLKTNQSVAASLTMATSYGNVTALLAGDRGNNISVTVDNAAGQRIITVADAVQGLSEVSSPLGGTVLFTIYANEGAISAGTMTITSTKLTTALTGNVITHPLNITLKNFNTIGQLADFISTQGYLVTTPDVTVLSQPISVLDQVSAVDIQGAPYSELRDLQDVKDFFASSALVSFSATAVKGLPTVATKLFLANGALGATSNANVQDCIDACLKARINFIVPLFSQDASADITLGVTDASSAYTIASIHAAMRGHVAQASTVKGKKERQAWVGFKGTYDDAKAAAATIGSARVSLCFQNVDIGDSTGSIVTAQPHMLAVASAGMHAAAVVGLPTTFKLVNVSGFSMDSNDFDPEVDADDAIDANMTFVEKAPGGGIRFVLDNSTYGQVDNAWIYNRPSVLYAADTSAFAIRLNTETFVGKRNSDITPETVKNLLISVLDGLRASGIIVPDTASGGKGYKDLTVNFTGSIINTSVTLILVEGFEFILNDITVQRAAS